MTGKNSNIDWPGLLRWSASYADGTRPTERKAISMEDIEFLENAILSMPDYRRLVENALPQLQNPNDDKVLDALQVIEDAFDWDPELTRNLKK